MRAPYPEPWEPPVRTPVLLLLLCLLAAAPLGAKEQYRIETRSPDSWAHYYQLIGLGTVHQRPLSEAEQAALAAHCDFLDQATGHDWIALGYSVERGYKLCYRSGPFSAAEATVFCDRLVMTVRENSSGTIVCETLRNDHAHLRRNPYRSIY